MLVSENGSEEEAGRPMSNLPVKNWFAVSEGFTPEVHEQLADAEKKRLAEEISSGDEEEKANSTTSLVSYDPMEAARAEEEEKERERLYEKGCNMLHAIMRLRLRLRVGMNLNARKGDVCIFNNVRREGKRGVIRDRKYGIKRHLDGMHCVVKESQVLGYWNPKVAKVAVMIRDDRLPKGEAVYDLLCEYTFLTRCTAEFRKLKESMNEI